LKKAGVKAGFLFCR